MKVDVINTKNKKVDTIDLPDRVFGVRWNPNLVHQVVVSEASNKRQVLAHTKGRGEVRGGGKKPWKQKHTGRARASSTRSPLWTGGGVTHGPTKERNFKKKINKKMRRLALYSILSKKLSDKEIRVVDSFALENHKTKVVAKILGTLRGSKSGGALVVPSRENKYIFLAARNIPKTTIATADNLNPTGCLVPKEIIFERGAVEELAKRSNAHE